MNGFPAQSTPSKGEFGHDISNTMQNLMQNLEIEDQKFKQYKVPNNNSINDIEFRSKTRPLFAKEESDKSSSVYIKSNSNDNDNNSKTNSNKSSQKSSRIKNRTTVPIENNTTNDADDEKDSMSLNRSNASSSNMPLQLDIEKLQIPQRSSYVPENTIKQLLNQLKLKEEELQQSQEAAQIMYEQLSSANVNANVNSGSIEQEFRNQKINLLNEEHSNRILNYVDNIQKLQCEVYQSELKDLKKQLSSKEDDYNELLANYNQLEVWTLALFKEVGERSQTWTNMEFQLSVADLRRYMKPPLKRSNLQHLYRYLVQILYIEDDYEEEEEYK